MSDLDNSTLHIYISSFSYKKGYPVSETRHGGGYVFDCRLLTNPGRDPAYKDVTGRDAVVEEYLKKYSDVEEFLSNIQSIISQAVTAYKKKGYGDLSIGFGCTGGQHRSVYCAERLAKFLKGDPALTVHISHREQNFK